MSRIIKSNLVKALDFKKIEALKLPTIQDLDDDKDEEIAQTEECSIAEIREKALKEKEAILASAHQEAKKIKSKAQQEGYQQGYNEGIMLSKEKMNQLEIEIKSKFQDLVENFHQTQEVFLSNAASEVVEIALFITKKLVGDLITEKEDLVIDLYKILLPMVTDKNITEIVVNPTDYDLIYDYLEKTQKVRDIKINTNFDISKGAIKVITEQGSLICDLNQQMEEIIRELRKLNG